MKHTSIRLETPVEFINITPFNPLISRCEIKVCYVGDQPNRNHSIITKEVATDIARSLPGSPIVGYYNEDKGDFEEHNRIIEISDGEFKVKDTTRPYGFVDLNAKVWFQKFRDDGMTEREYLMTEGWLWTGQYPECQRILRNGNNQSMELDEDTLDATWAEGKNSQPDFFIINEAIISKLCVLGEENEPCFEGATIGAPTIQFSFDDGFKTQLFSMMNELKDLLSKGGEKVDNTEEVKDIEESVAEESTTEAEESVVEESVVEEPTTEAEEPEVIAGEVTATTEDKIVKYDLNEIQEYQELLNRYSELETQYSQANDTISQLQLKINSLTEFKSTVERNEKKKLIDSFYMLSDEEKSDVINNIDKYSIDEIEAKLSVICVRNKVNFNLDDSNNKSNAITTFNLDGGISGDEDTPDWVKALRAVASKM